MLTLLCWNDVIFGAVMKHWWFFPKIKSHQDKIQFSSVKEQSKPASIIHVFTIMRYDLWAWECLIWHREEEWNDNVWADGRPSKHFLSEQTFLQKCWTMNMGESSWWIQTVILMTKSCLQKSQHWNYLCLTTQGLICLMIAKEKVANLSIKTDEQSEIPFPLFKCSWKLCQNRYPRGHGRVCG